MQDYEAFLGAYPNDPMARRVRAIVAARREAVTWRRSRTIDTPAAYWSYLRRYPNGTHAGDARRRLASFAAVLEPPPRFDAIVYDVPPPPPEEIIYVERPVLVFDDPVFAFAPPPPPPIFFLPPRPVYIVELLPPPPPVYAYVLPVPAYTPVPVWVNRPRYVAPPPTNIIYNNIHNTVVVNNTTNMVTITNPRRAKSDASACSSGKSRPSTVSAIAAGCPGTTVGAIRSRDCRRRCCGRSCGRRSRGFARPFGSYVGRAEGGAGAHAAARKRSRCASASSGSSSGSTSRNTSRTSSEIGA